MSNKIYVFIFIADVFHGVEDTDWTRYRTIPTANLRLKPTQTIPGFHFDGVPRFKQYLFVEFSL